MFSELRQGSRHLSGCFPRDRKACRHLSFSFYTYLYMVCREAHSFQSALPRNLPNLPNIFFIIIYLFDLFRRFPNIGSAASVARRTPDEKTGLIVPLRCRVTFQSAKIVLFVVLFAKEVITFRECGVRGGSVADAHAGGTGEDSVF